MNEKIKTHLEWLAKKVKHKFSPLNSNNSKEVQYGGNEKRKLFDRYWFP